MRKAKGYLPAPTPKPRQGGLRRGDGFMNAKPSILLVEVNSGHLEALESEFGDEYELDCVPSADACLERMKVQYPNVILIDVNIPDLNWSELCINIRAQFHADAITIILISMKDCLKEKMLGYDVGADDFIIRPFSHEEIIGKVNHSLQLRQERAIFRDNLDKSNERIICAMADINELELVMEFLEASYQCNTYRELAQTIFDSMSRFSKDCSVQVRGIHGDLCLSDHGPITPLETDLFDQLKDEDAIYDYGGRTLFNSDHLSLLVKNMPEDDPEHVAKLKQLFHTLVHGANSKVNFISTQMELLEQNEEVQSLLRETETALHNIEKKLHTQGSETTVIMDTLIRDLEFAITRIGLNAAQEEQILSLVDHSLEKLVQLYAQGVDIENSFDYVTQSMQLITSQLHH
jgi:DNA-binding response OmpR family regulator